MSATRIAVVGAGGVGSYFAAKAASAGADVTLCLRRPRPDLVVRTNGEELRPSVRSVTDPADVPEVDWVFLATKAQQTPDTRPWLEALDRGPEGPPLVMLQNGVRLADRVTGMWNGSVLPAVVLCAVEMVSPGIVEHHSMGFFSVQDGADGRRLADVFGPDQREVRLVPDVIVTGWQKLVSNAAGNSLTALTLQRDEVLHDPGVADLARSIMTECVAVAAADGVNLPPDSVDSTLRRLQELPAGTGSSMLYDRLAGRELEHEALIGAVVQIGVERQVATPVSATVLTLLRAVSGHPLPSAD